MPKTNVVKLPSCPPTDISDNPMILCAVSPCFQKEFSYKRSTKDNEWYIDVRASTVDGLISFLSQCKHVIPAFRRGAAK